MKKYNNYQICDSTVMDTSDQGIKFDSVGMCNYASDYYNKILPIW